jgi:hypothetical protein
MADPDIGADHGAGADHRPRADFDARPDHRQWIDDHVVLQMRGRVNDGGRRDAGLVKPGLRAKGVAVKFARNLDELAERMRRAQHRNTRRNPCFETPVDQAGSGLG